MAQFTEEEKMMRRIEKRFCKGTVEYGLIDDGDKITKLCAKFVMIYTPRCI